MNQDCLIEIFKEIENLMFCCNGLVSVGRFSVGRSGVHSKINRPTADRVVFFNRFWESFLRCTSENVSRSVGRFTVTYL